MSDTPDGKRRTESAFKTHVTSSCSSNAPDFHGRRAEVDEALKRLDAAFSEARLSDEFTGCPCCFTADDVHYVSQTAAADLSHRVLEVVSSSLVSTLGSGHDVPYFVPLVMRAAADGALIDMDAFAARLAYVPDTLWSADRTGALSDTFELLFEVADEFEWDLGLGERETRERIRAALAAVFRDVA